MTKVTISEQGGVRNLHLDSPWIQGSMRLAAPDAIELEYVQQMMMWMLFMPAPRHIAQLGLGAGALTKFCYRHFPQSDITAVELNPAVISTCHSMFALPACDARLDVLNRDARDFVADPAFRERIDILQVDLYGENATRPAVDTPEFYRDCASCLRPGGMLTVNLLGCEPIRQQSLAALDQAFEAIAWLPRTVDGNLIAIGFKSAPEVDFEVLYERAAQIEDATGLPAESWVRGLESWMMGS